MKMMMEEVVSVHANEWPGSQVVYEISHCFSPLRVGTIGLNEAVLRARLSLDARGAVLNLRSQCLLFSLGFVL